MKSFRKRVFTIKSFFNAMYLLFINFGALKKAFKQKNIDSSFRERILLAVTQVNQCRFCSFGHTKAALATGMSANEIKEILDADFNHVPENQKLALCFAQHYAETDGAFDQASFNRLNETYGAETTHDILAYTRFMVFCNLCGNTLDAFLLRFTGVKIHGSVLLNELVVIIAMIVILPFMLIIALVVK